MIGMYAAIGVLSLAFCLCCVWFTCLKITDKSKPTTIKTTQKINVYKKSNVVPSISTVKQSNTWSKPPAEPNHPPSMNTRIPINPTMPTKSTEKIETLQSSEMKEKISESPTRDVSLKERQKTLQITNESNEESTKKHIVQRYQSYMDDAVRIDLHRQHAKQKALKSMKVKRENKEALRRKHSSKK
jgi:hypothetical protein